MTEDPTGLGPASERDPLVRSLRGALTREADRVVPGRDGLRRIRAGIEARERAAAAARQRRFTLLAAGVAGILVTGGVITALTQLDGGDGRTEISPATTAPSRPTASASPGPSAPGLPVYYAGRLAQADRLFREFHPVSGSGEGSGDVAGRVQAAVSQAMSQRPDDPDYQTLWAAGADARTTVGPDLITIRLNEAAAGGVGVAGPPDLDATALQQLIWTSTAAAAPAGRTGPVRVRISADGPTPNQFGSIDLSQPFRRGNQPGDTDPRAPVWIDSLGQDATARVGRLTVRGQALGTAVPVTWSLELGGVVVDSGSVRPTTAAGGELGVGVRGEWTATVDLPSAGRYRLSVTLDVDDGGGGTDTKDFVVQN